MDGILFLVYCLQSIIALNMNTYLWCMIVKVVMLEMYHNFRKARGDFLNLD
jgi:hypothetical protein